MGHAWKNLAVAVVVVAVALVVVFVVVVDGVVGEKEGDEIAVVCFLASAVKVVAQHVVVVEHFGVVTHVVGVGVVAVPLGVA